MPFFSPYEIAIKAGESHSVIRVTNLQTTAKVGTDAWGISGKAQPVLISASVSLRHPFSTASREDSVDDSTLHYGKLSKAILEAARTFQGVPQNVAKLYSHPLDKLGREDQYSSRTLWLFWEHIVRCLTANLMITDTNTGQLVRDTSCEVIDARTVKSLEIKVQLPKASLLGSGVSIGGIVLLKERCEMEAIHNEQDREALAHYDQTICLKLHGLRIPTLIGVNPNERLAKQTVIANIEVDPWIVREDLYAQLEEIVVKTIEESSFETLEALAHHTAWRVWSFFIKPAHAMFGEQDVVPRRIKICFEKPTAVTFADAPAVEFTLSSGSEMPVSDMRYNITELPPFPMQGRIEDWIRKAYPDYPDEGLSRNSEE